MFRWSGEVGESVVSAYLLLHASIKRPGGHLSMNLCLVPDRVFVCVLTFAVAPFFRVEPHGKGQQLRWPTPNTPTFRGSRPVAFSLGTCKSLIV